MTPKYRNYMLTGDYKGYWECHINPDWLLLYEKDTEIRIISRWHTQSLNLRPLRNKVFKTKIFKNLPQILYRKEISVGFLKIFVPSLCSLLFMFLL